MLGMDDNLLAPTEREELMGCLMGLAKMNQDRMAEGAARLGLTLSQARVLYFVESEPMVRKLAKKLSCDPSYITGVVDALEKEGLLTRQVNPDDRRIKKLVLTSKGESVRAEVAKVISESFELDGLVSDEAMQFAQLLRKIQAEVKTAAW